MLQVSEFEQPGNDSFNCTPPAIKEFPPDGLTRQQRQAGFIIIHFVITIYLFLLLAIVCDDYFVPSIKKICESEYKRELFGNIHSFSCDFNMTSLRLLSLSFRCKTNVRRLQFGVLCYVLCLLYYFFFINMHECKISHNRTQCYRGCGWRDRNGGREFKSRIVHQRHRHLHYRG